jgi:hypothetical protein
MTEDEYKKEFGIDPYDKEKLEAALEHALDIRKFEIEMYWKRATYFWALIAVTFAGYFAVIGSDKIPDKDFMAYSISCIGLLFTFAWFQVNRGSKYWQENWENHVDMLEDKVTGPLYKTVLSRPKSSDFFESSVTGPATISASKTNQMVSLFVIFIWAFLSYKTFSPFEYCLPFDWERISMGSITAIFAFVISRKGKTYTGCYEHMAYKRSSKVIE